MIFDIKKTILWILLAAVLAVTSPITAWAEGEDDPLWNRPSYEKKVYNVGQRILAANGVEERIFFRVLNDSDEVNANARRGGGDHNMVTVYRGILDYMDNDDELAALLGHEIAHILKRHNRKTTAKRVGVAAIATTLMVAAAAAGGGRVNPVAGRQVIEPFANRVGKGYETEADLVGLDLMVKAGYNPVAMETLMTKTSGDAPPLTRFFSSHPAGTKRINDIHEYLAEKYPQFLTDELARALPGAPFPLQKNTNDTPLSEVSAVLSTADVAEINGAALPVTETPPSNDDTAINTTEKINPEKINDDQTSAPTIKTPEKIVYAFNERPSSGSSSDKAKQDKNPSVAQQLLTLNGDSRLLIKTLSEEEYLDIPRLQTLFNGMNREALEIMIYDLEDKDLIRLVGPQSDLMIILTERVAAELGLARK